ncbi:hyphally regulated cell wall protein 3 [Drosophila subobscura]|uniref:hyphally regulated cell wall protein 3 n=1 Tax=Drosophila subobscura TaxID=7241 RepID=UPI00155B0B2C|nr:hyphally regulated cell wall protein 3 [Drosophila subobscura]XP_034672229.1 hyphally regulated cell wall protein 3 [Drosophila subobscura]XP_034672230.1 hyphally regulated cell wall protein 3 [Drosophila subobscura]XP_034672231.1 hyphally regulated cell wall protein 3 [Drosophila subobscura]
MANGKATVSFFENGSTTQFEYCFKLYPQVLKMKAEKRSKKPQELIRLDQWYQNDLPRLIKARGKDAHMVYDELVQTMKWKQSRGKFYPQLSYLVKVNTPRAVMQETKKAFRKLPNLEQAITALSNLKGVGTTMASALLAAAAPDRAPFMADECLMAIPEIEGIDYTTKEYLNFVNHIQSTVERLNAEVGGETPHWSPHRVELALWSHYVANDLSPEMLDDMPPPGTASISTNGASNNVLDGDDTNDGVAVDLDDESQGAGGRNTATESETENENTNPAALTPLNVGEAKSNATAVGAALQDGDSNFVSNDSTSQEPIIDDNDGTTQTTATTSTEDGEPIGIGIGLGSGGTPLASDSESNLEAPLNTNRLNAAGPVQPSKPQSQPSTQNQTQTLSPTHNNSKQQINNGQATPAEQPPAKGGPATATAAANGNGNGNGVLGVNDLDDGEEEEDEEDELDEEENNEDAELEADESNSSNSNARESKLQQLADSAGAGKVATTVTETVAAAIEPIKGAATETTLSSPAIGQKRTALHCEMELSNAPAGAVGGGDKSPELKKLRSE